MQIQMYTWHKLTMKYIITTSVKNTLFLRDRPFNLQGGIMVFLFRPEIFSDYTRVRIFFFFVAQSAKFFSKILNQIIFFFHHQNQNIFFSNIGNQNIFLEKNHTPPPPFKLNGLSLIALLIYWLIYWLVD